ncbi:hypothetical protein SAMN04487866_12247 [Thermoactinomyces sp. DSM 45891]|uniref:hypothetical protein n=1 Tax=Thermoactinomyces sp. DSM 45891 TaxID=1761907 RepID=UPI0009165CA5|nr:hypothetical protein [Thermoactinomyces sp. DSM 45891]SFX75363.1 hypothetical protein SAMN04487866_12247 [Thermoactinomyces sp. DSM 45891]
MKFFLATNPIDKIKTFIDNELVNKALTIIPTVSALAFIGLSLMVMFSQDEHQRQKFRTGLWWTGGATVVALMAKVIVEWLKAGFN